MNPHLDTLSPKAMRIIQQLLRSKVREQVQLGEMFRALVDGGGNDEQLMALARIVANAGLAVGGAIQIDRAPPANAPSFYPFEMEVL